MPKRYVQIYTGDGKGKTTAAIGLVVRAVGAGWKTCFIQFLKSRPSSEQRPLSRLPGVKRLRFGRVGWVRGPIAKQDAVLARAGLTALRRALLSGKYDLIVADELCVCVDLGLLPEAEVLDVMRARPAGVELVLTGRDATPRMRAAADLVTDMRVVKHYYKRGVKARRGIEY
jgi:cob(I)alamin adenosyltransferase